VSLSSKRASPIVHAAEHKEVSESATFFAQADTHAVGSDQATEIKRPTSLRKPTRTFFDAGQCDPLFTLSTHRAPMVRTAEQRQERKEFEEERARVGLSNLMAKILGH